MTVCLEKSPVAWLERDYDNWRVERQEEREDIDGSYYMRLSCYPNRINFRPGPSHHQSVIMFKDDVPYDWTDENARRHWNCWQCPESLSSIQGRQHTCKACGTPVRHNQDHLCDACADNEWNPLTDAEVMRRHAATTDDPVPVQAAQPSQAGVPIASLVSGLRRWPEVRAQMLANREGGS